MEVKSVWQLVQEVGLKWRENTPTGKLCFASYGGAFTVEPTVVAVLGVSNSIENLWIRNDWLEKSKLRPLAGCLNSLLVSIQVFLRMLLLVLVNQIVFEWVNLCNLSNKG